MAASPHVRILAAYITTISDAPLVAIFDEWAPRTSMPSFLMRLLLQPTSAREKNSGRPQAARCF